VDPTNGPTPWWQSGVIYQIYPRSFQDSDGDGVGDLPGILARLSHLTWLGVAAIWISPIFRSPMADFGYDVADYRDVDPLFGTLGDLDRLIAEAHARGIRVLLDLVPNHTSDQHPWFLESRSSRTNPKRDWYVWADGGPDGGPPNAWQSMFGGSAWTFDPPTGQWYYHGFLREQPDLDWRNPAVEAELLDTMRWWFARGVDGFRIDVLWLLLKDPAAPLDPERPWGGRADLPGMIAIAQRMRAVADEFEGRVLIGEIYLPLDRLVRYYGPDGRGIHLPFNFQLIGAPWDAPTIGEAIRVYEAALPPGAWPDWVLGNHDQSRIASRAGARQIRAAAMLLLTLRGTPTIYDGDEIGMGDVDVPPARRVDPAGILGPSRDPERAPLRWTAGPGGGFTTGEPWLPMAPDVPGASVEAQRDDPDSVLALHRGLLALRRREPALSLGSIEVLAAQPDGLLAYRRSLDGRSLVIALALGDRAVDTHSILPPAARILLATRSDLTQPGRLAPGDGVIVEEA
jgi:alpha-glucosidase